MLEMRAEGEEEEFQGKGRIQILFPILCWYDGVKEELRP